jgi:chemotaxis protein CheX
VLRHKRKFVPLSITSSMRDQAMLLCDAQPGQLHLTGDTLDQNSSGLSEALDQPSLTVEETQRIVDASVAEIFDAMIRRSCRVAGSTTWPRYGLSTRVLFSGEVSGECIVELPRSAAARIAEALLGGPGDLPDSMIDDAAGELCNMIAGGWKSRVHGLGSMCQLSPPEILHGLRESALPPCVGRLYCFDEEFFQVGISIEREP